MNLRNLNQTELDQRMKTLAQRERDVLCEILLTIKEIDGRRMYLELGFPSLFDYLTKSVGYSEGSAQRRIDAARLLQEVPEMAPKIQSGEIKLSQVSLVQKAAREVVRTQSVKVNPNDKMMLLKQISSLNRSESELQVASFFDLPVRQNSHTRVQADESVRVELTLSRELHDKIKQAQELLSHSLPSGDLVAFLEFVSDKVIKQKTAVRGKSQVTNCDRAAGENLQASSTATVAVRSTIYKHVLQKQKCCQFKDASGKQCGSRWHLQIDHVQPRWAGGGNEVENLQVLCAQHNRLKYRKESGLRVG
ncbi:HNH endonuclease [Bdellovibrio svalbardensis]|uniref:HNH endonuclease n=1 Tax=Bdellovibrio svalbardensis TaxID=2972972 RepID=A0ABT6DLJ8_9BACT|nr:HNH endonuclease signature motif containing protein [Bdellovibrio svalbardensis]MDG0816003.1 HNH endonuclease [Bdellovibrio svalbardensis]